MVLWYNNASLVNILRSTKYLLLLQTELIITEIYYKN